MKKIAAAVLASALAIGVLCAQTLGPQVLVYTAGSWVPALIGSTTPGTGQTYSNQFGSYEQIGRQVTVRFTITATSLGTAAGNLQISGLPGGGQAAGSEIGACTIVLYSVAGLAATNYGIQGFISGGTSVIGLLSNSNTGFTILTVTQAGNSAVLDGFCTYRTS